MGEEIGKGAQPDVAFTFAIGFEESVSGEGVGEEMAELEEVVEECATLDGGHRSAEEVDPHDLVDLSVLLRVADVFTV